MAAETIATIQVINDSPQLVISCIERILLDKTKDAKSQAFAIREFFGLPTICKDHNKPIVEGYFCEDCLSRLKHLFQH